MSSEMNVPAIVAICADASVAVKWILDEERNDHRTEWPWWLVCNHIRYLTEMVKERGHIPRQATLFEQQSQADWLTDRTDRFGRFGDVSSTAIRTRIRRSSSAMNMTRP
jgi:hypothetical protein